MVEVKLSHFECFEEIHQPPFTCNYYYFILAISDNNARIMKRLLRNSRGKSCGYGDALCVNNKEER